MPMIFLDIGYFIIFSLLQCSTAMLWKSPKYHISKYFKKQSKATFYIKTPYNGRKNIDYNYKDWEEKKPDIYDYIFPTTPSNLLDNSQHNITYSYSFTYTNHSSTEPTPDTSFATSWTDSTPPINITSFSTSSHNTTTTTLIPENSTENIITPTSTVVVIDLVNQSIRKEIEEAAVDLRGGYFTAIIYVLLKIIEKKENEDLAKLIDGVDSEFIKLNHLQRLAMFGPMLTTIFTAMVKIMATSPVEFIKIQAKSGRELLENKKLAFQGDIKSVFDIIDAIYVEEDYMNIAEVLTDIHNFPNVSMYPMDLAEKAVVAFIFIPYRRIEGSPQEQMLLTEINNLVLNRIYINKDMTITRNFRKYNEITTKMAAPFESIIKFKSKKYTKTLKRKALRTLKTVYSSETDYKIYLKDPKITKHLRHQMRIFEEKFRKFKKKNRKRKAKRGPINITYSTTANTEIPPIYKSKHYLRKYVKNLYKMRTIAIKTSRVTPRFYGNFGKFNKFDTIKTKTDFSSNDSSHSKRDYSDSDEDNYESDDNESNGVTISMASNKLKSVTRFYTYKKHTLIRTITKHILHYRKDSKEKSRMKKKNINKIQRYFRKADISDSNAEAYLEVNLNDALLHKNNVTIGRRFIMKKLNNLRKMDSFSDDETILKSNIYKVFGYSKDFAKQLRAML